MFGPEDPFFFLLPPLSRYTDTPLLLAPDSVAGESLLWLTGTFAEQPLTLSYIYFSLSCFVSYRFVHCFFSFPLPVATLYSFSPYEVSGVGEPFFSFAHSNQRVPPFPLPIVTRAPFLPSFLLRPFLNLFFPRFSWWPLPDSTDEDRYTSPFFPRVIFSHPMSFLTGLPLRT